MNERTGGTATATAQLLKLTVQSGDRRVDVALPGSVPVAEIVPSVARRLGVLDAVEAHAGYWFVRPDGDRLDPDRSLVAQGMLDGDVVALEIGADAPPAKTYDDIVEAVADAVEERAKPWTPGDTVTTTTVVASVLLTLALLPVLVSETVAHSIIVPVGTGLSGLLLLICAAVLARIGTPPQAPVALVQVAAAHAAVAGFTATGLPWSWGVPTALAGAGAALVGGIAMLLVTKPREYSLVPLVIGVVLGLSGLMITLTGAEPAAILAIALALSGIAGLGIPWLALASTSLRVVSARGDSEIYAAPESISRAEVAERFATGHRFQVALRIAVSAIALLATAPVVASGAFGLALAVLTYLGLILGVRQVFARTDIVIVTATSMVGSVLMIVVAVAAFPDWSTWIIVALAIVAAAVIGLGLLAPKHRLWIERVMDPAELVVIALLPPLAILVGGWF
ncbi:type VII secretion integral membrane protein EccD [Microbacterium sediminis]|uniref:type VII secretion integral membrane protein EccD n=1 Tax=Microbacterium sediminis TaxID=904291 RepID=UPI001071D936|nr:type VII secretion integral membrane protein EccD [Microbacterium sediminis]QBR75117.1 type VII secretion integral membrane protein EccD [Microbacterium sediminis]